MKILTAGTLVAIPLSVLWFGAATSQTLPHSSGTIDQVQFGDVIATGTLDVDDPSDSIPQTTVAGGNSLGGLGADAVQIDAEARQRMYGNVLGYTTVNLNSSHPASVVADTHAFANSATGTSTADGVLILGLRQQSRGGEIKAGTEVNAASGGADEFYASSNAVANTAGLGADQGHTEGRIRQGNSANVIAAVGGNIGYVPNTINFASTAVANNVTGSGINGSEMLIEGRQTTSADHIQATSFLSIGNGQTIAGATTAVANNVAVNNEGGPLEVRTDQVNKSYIRSESVTSADLFGSATAMAYGVGNSVLAGEYGESLTIDNHQTNTGADIDVLATANGREGYDLSAQATAMGNAITGYACSECGGVINVGSRQVNRSNVTASSSIRTTGSNRSMQGSSVAIGNSATFYVSSSGGD